MAKTYYMQYPDGMVFTTSNPEYHSEAKQLPQTKGMEMRRQYCIEQLRKFIQPGQKIYCMLRSVSGSGMSRVISLYVVQNNELRNIDVMASDVLLYSMGSHGGIKIGGCGMDM